MTLSQNEFEKLVLEHRPTQLPGTKNISKYEDNILVAENGKVRIYFYGAENYGSYYIRIRL